MELLPSPSPSLNPITSFPPQNLYYHSKPPFSHSNFSYPPFSISSTNSFKPRKLNPFHVSLSLTHKNSNDPLHNSFFFTPNNSCHNSPSSKTASSTSTATPFSSTTPGSSEYVHWMVIMDKPPQEFQSKFEIINYYVSVLETVLGSEKEAQSCIYDASCDTHFGFCCSVDEETSRVIAGLPGVLSVKPDPDINSVRKDYSSHNLREDSLSNSINESTLLFPNGSKYWLVCVEKPSSRVSSKAQVVDSYVKTLTKVLGNDNVKDGQMCIYHVSWQSNFGFCCNLDEESAKELAAIPGVLSVQPDEHFESDTKDYAGNRVSSSGSDSTNATDISKTKLFITGLSFYTSEKTLRSAFEPFGELVEVKVIMDKISKRSKGYAFVEYTTEDAATTALQETNGKIINGWMIVVDRAKKKPQYIKKRARTL